MKMKDLKKQIKQLNETIDQQNRLIEEQNKLIVILRNNNYNYPNIPFVQTEDLCNDGKEHEYPMPWHSVTSPNCKKCGKQAPNYGITFTTSNTSGDQHTTYSDYNWVNLESLA